MSAPELRRRIGWLMLFRLVLITLVLSLTIVLNLASPQDLALPGSVSVFVIVAATYALSLGYALALPRVRDPKTFASAQLAADLLITTALVHVSGGAQSGYTFFYPLSIIAAAIVRERRGAILVAISSVVLFTGIATLGWLDLVPSVSGSRLSPSDLTTWQFVRQLMLNVGAMVAVAFLAATLGDQLARAGQSLIRQQARALDLAALKDDILRSLSSGLVTVDLDGRILTFNEAAGEILGSAPGTTVGRPVGEVLPELMPILAKLDERKAVRRSELTTRRLSDRAELVLGVSVSPLMNGKGVPIGRIVNFQDLTELRKMEVQVKRGERLAAIGGLAAGIAHEIRNPLASISGSIELLRTAPQVDAENRALMEIVLREVDRLNGMVTELLEYARPRPAVPVPIDVVALIDETVRVFSQDRSGGARVRFDRRAGDEITLQADPAQLRQVLWNLLRNAAEAMKETSGEIAVSYRARKDWVEILVSDDGVGIAREDQERIFEPFYTTKSRGSGLGLAMVHRIVTEHGGTITVKSEVGRGTTVTVRLPIARDSA
jgi:two-component system sensor histidine kinase PilS (NtrC family)